MNKKVLILISIFSILSCSAAGVRNVEYADFERSVTVQKSYDDVWGSILEWSAVTGFPINSVDRDSGVIILAYAGLTGFSFGDTEIDESLVSCGEATGNIGLYGARFSGMTVTSTIIRDLGGSTRVTVNLTGTVAVEVRNAIGVVSSSLNTCPSRGIFESHLFAHLST
jgi:hypothetical protein